LGEMPKRVVATVCSARRYGNCRDIAERILERLREKGPRLNFS